MLTCVFHYQKGKMMTTISNATRYLHYTTENVQNMVAFMNTLPGTPLGDQFEVVCIQAFQLLSFDEWIEGVFQVEIKSKSHYSDLR